VLAVIASFVFGNGNPDGQTVSKVETPAQAPTPLPASAPYGATSRSNPAPVGAAVIVKFAPVLSDATVEARLTLLEVQRSAAPPPVVEVPSWLEAGRAPAGHKWLLAKVRIEVLGAKPEDYRYAFHWYDFIVVAHDGKVYEQVNPNVEIVRPEKSFDFELFAGATAEGWVPFHVRADDSSPLLAFTRRISGGVPLAWWRLY
jgi:hypothetical protein